MRGKDTACGGRREDAGLASELGRTVAFACEDGGNGGSVGMDDCAVVQPLTLGQPTRLLAESVMGLPGCLQVAHQAFTLVLGQMGRTLAAVLGGLCSRANGASQLQKRLCGVAHQADADFAPASALAATAAHDLGEVLVERVGLAL